MDAAIRKLLIKAEKEESKFYLAEAFEKLSCGRETTDQTDPFRSDLFVTCAEVALKEIQYMLQGQESIFWFQSCSKAFLFGTAKHLKTAGELSLVDIAENCLKLFFQKTPPTNQFLCRAYLCQAKLSSPTSSDDKAKLQQCIGYLIKAINFGKTSKRYHFMVYNASVLYWAFIRPFLKPNYRHILAKSFHIVVKSLDDTNDPDLEWRAHLMIALMECHIDAGRKDDALHVGQAAMQFMKVNLPHKCKEVFLMQLHHKLLEPPKIQSLMKASPELTYTYKIHKIKIQSENTSSAGITNDLQKLYKSIVEEEEVEGKNGSVGQRGYLPLTARERDALLLDLTRLCLDVDHPKIALGCINTLKKSADMNEETFCRTEFLSCEFMVANLKDKKESYTKKAINTRIDAIEKLSEHLLHAHRLRDENLIQIGCATLWNLSLPLLQKNLRSKIQNHLLLAANLLEEIDSLLLLLRCQVHTEVAKCEEQRDQLQLAVEHFAKALSIDDSGVYKSRLEHCLKRVKLKALLYQEPENAEDHAAMIIEQVDSCSDQSNTNKMQVYLSKAGSLLAPDSFMLAMDGEASLKKITFNQWSFEMLWKQVKNFEKGVAKIQGHLKRLQGVNEKERIKLWADLVKTARKQNVWDVTRVAARFCLLYDNEWFSCKSVECTSPSKSVDGKTPTPNSNNSATEMGTISKEELKGMEAFAEDDDILRIFAEVNFIYAESLVQLLQNEGFQLLEKVVAPKDTKLRPKKYQQNSSASNNDANFKSYAEWIDKISKEALNRFQMGANHGAALNSPLLVCNAAIYVWNFTKHLHERKELTELTIYYLPLFQLLRRVGHGRETVFLCDFTLSLTQSFMKAHISQVCSSVQKQHTPQIITPVHNNRKSGRGGASHMNLNKGKSSGGASSVLNADSSYNLQQAMEILEYVLSIISDNDPKNQVPIAIRHKLIQAHVLCKGMLNQNLPKFANDNDCIDSSQSMSRAFYALEALSMLHKRIGDFNPAPTVKDVIQRVENANWTDTLLLLQVWTRLAEICFENGDYETSTMCSNNALNLNKQKRNIKQSKHDTVVEKELLYYASVLKGECYVTTMNGRSEIRRKGLACFVDACRFAKEANNYDLVMNAARQYWNNVHTFIESPIERQLLQEPIKTIINDINFVSKTFPDVFEVEEKKVSNDITDMEERNEKENNSTRQLNIDGQKIGNQKTLEEKKKKLDEDLHLRAALYSVLFQTYAYKGDFDGGLHEMDEAIKTLPRTHHRLVLFKHRIITQAKLNKPIQFDMGKFRDEPEDLLSQMWHRVAKSSKEKKDQLTCFVNSIDVLTLDIHLYQKVEYLAEFGEWLFLNEYPKKKAIEHFKYAISLLVNSAVQNEKANLSGGKDKNVHVSNETLHMFTDIKLMDVLVQIYVRLSCLIGYEEESFDEYTLAAAMLIKQMWKVALVNVESYIKSGVSPGQVQNTSIKPLKIGKLDSNISGRKSNLPRSSEGWAKYKLPDKYVSYFKADVNGSFISAKSLERPSHSIYFYEILCENLYVLGFHDYAIQIMALMSHIVENILCDSSLTLLMHMNFSNLCEKLHLGSALHHHQEFLLPEKIELSEVEQAESREEIEIWKERQRQVLSEEVRQGGKIKSYVSCTDQVSRKISMGGHLHKRKVWVKIAEFLISKTQHYQQARKYLEEANRSAVTFSDEETVEIIKYVYAMIASQNADWGKSITLLSNITTNLNPQLIWMKKLSLLADCLVKYSMSATTFQSRMSDDGIEKAKRLLSNALDTVQLSSTLRRNGMNFTAYIAAKIMQKIGVVYYTESINNKRIEIMDQKDLLENSSEYLRKSLLSFDQLRCCLDTVEILPYLINVHIKLARIQESEEERKSFLLNTLGTCAGIMRKVYERWLKVKNMSSIEEAGSCFVPIQHCLMQAKSAYVQVIQEILKIMLEKRRKERIIEEAKGKMQRIIDKFIEISPELSGNEIEWQNICSSIQEKGVVLLSSNKSLCAGHPLFIAETSLQLGVFMRYVALYKCAGRFNPWHLQERNEVEEEQTKDDKNHSFTLELQTYAFNQSQAAHSLTQCLQLALQNSNIPLISSAAYELLEITGLLDPLTSIQFLALYQSANASLEFHSLLDRVFLHADTSASASLYKQYKQQSVHAQPVLASLMEQEWWKRLTVSRNHFDILKELPLNVTYVLLQHSPDKDFLYGGVFERAQPALSGKGKRNMSRTCICRTKTNRKTMTDLKEMLHDFKSNVGNELLKQMYFKEQYDRRRELLGDKAISEEVNQEEALTDKGEFQKIEEQFEVLLATLEAYIGPVLKSIHESLLVDPIPTTVMILADVGLLEFPLECLSIFQKVEIQGLCRDFSLQMLYHRFKRGDGDSSRQSKMEQKGDAQSKGKQDKGGGKGDKAAVTGKAKAGDKKGSMKEFVIDKDNIQLDLSCMKYLLDPFQDADENDIIFEELSTTYKVKTSKWTGIKGSEEVPNTKTLQELLCSSPSFLLYGYERFVSMMQASSLLPLNLNDCFFTLILDLVQTSRSHQRQGQIDSLKSRVELENENPLKTAMMMSLCGVSSVALNQWQTDSSRNKERLTTFFSGMFEHAMTVSQAVRSLNNVKADETINDDETIRQKNKQNLSHKKNEKDSCTSPEIDSKNEHSQEITILSQNCYYENYNLVIYGLPNFICTG